MTTGQITKGRERGEARGVGRECEGWFVWGEERGWCAGASELQVLLIVIHSTWVQEGGEGG